MVVVAVASLPLCPTGSRQFRLDDKDALGALAEDRFPISRAAIALSDIGNLAQQNIGNAAQQDIGNLSDYGRISRPPLIQSSISRTAALFSQSHTARCVKSDSAI